MTTFLTSNIGGIKKENGKKIVTKLFEDNNFLNNLKLYLKGHNKFVLIASDPNSYERNDLFLNMDKEAFKLSGIEFKEYVLLDNRNSNDIKSVFQNSDLIILSGGDTFIQNKFFNEINLKEYIKNIDSVIVGISAGSINAAKEVYNSPEKEEDLINPEILEGLYLTNINIEPHFDIDEFNSEYRKIQLDSMIKESYNRVIYALEDGSYILVNNNNNTIYGKCYKIHNGTIELICDNNEFLEIKENKMIK